MVIVDLRALEGPNVFHSLPVLLMTLNLQRWADVGSHEIPGFSKFLINTLPGLGEHSCSPGYPGGFVERLERGTYLAHIIEHIALEISQLAGMNVTYGKTRYGGQPGYYDVVVRYQNEAGMRLCLHSAVEMVRFYFEKKNFDLATRLEEVREAVRETKLGPTGEALRRAAIRRGIPCRRLASGSLLQLGYGQHRRRLQTAVSDRTSLVASDMVQDKQLTKNLLAEAGISVSPGLVIESEQDLMRVESELQAPYAVKPLDGHHGDGVSLNVSSRKDLFKAYSFAKEFSDRVLVEEMCWGRDYRLLVIDGKFVAAAERVRPQVTGDGRSTLLELIDRLNQDPRRGVGHESSLTRIEVDGILLENLKRQNLHIESVPEKGQTIILRPNANLSSGGTARDATEEVHPEVKAFAERIARLVDLDICGIDVITKDLSLPPGESLKVLEVNAGPGLRMHLDPSEGTARDVADDIVSMMYPPGAESRIPLISVTGTNGKTTVVRLIHKILSSDSCVGMTTSDGVYVGTRQIMKGDTTGPQSAHVLLSDTLVEKAVLEVARGGLLRRGLGYDWSDVAVITNIREDHIGQDGIESVEDLVWIKSLVAERVKANGTIVLNADDERSLSLMSNPRILKTPRRYLLYSLYADNPDLHQHLMSGGDAVWCEGGWIFLQIHRRVHRLLSVHNLKFTFEGRASFQVSNSLAAVGASAALGATADQITMGLMSFQPNLDNRGRLNTYRVGHGHVILDYGHNPDALASMGQFLSQWPNLRRTAVVGLPGDRSDEILMKSSESLARYFHKAVFRDDSDLRGRAPRQVPEMLKQAATQFNSQFQSEIVLREKDAVAKAIQDLKADEVVVLFYDSFSEAMSALRQFDPIPVHALPISEESRRTDLHEPEIYTSHYQVMA